MNKGTKNVFRRVLSLLLVMMLLVSQAAIVTLAEGSTADPTYTYLAFTSDIHNNPADNTSLNRLKSWLPGVSDALGGVVFDTFGSCGDMGKASGGLTEAQYWSTAKDIIDYVRSSGLAAHTAFTTGNHEVLGPGYYKDNVTYAEDTPQAFITQAGNPYAASETADDADAAGELVAVPDKDIYDPQGYKVFCFGANDDEQYNAFTDADIDALEEFLNECGEDEPVFIMSHYPLHNYNSRTISNKDTVISLLNQHPNAVFLWGHNHTEADVHYDKVITGTLDGTTSINFVYAAAGCMSDSEYSAGSQSVQAKGMVVTLDGDNTFNMTYYKEDCTPLVSYNITIGDSGSVAVKQRAVPLAPNFDEDKVFEAMSSIEDGRQYVISAEGYGMLSTEHSGYTNNSGYSYYGFNGAEVEDNGKGFLTAGVTADMLWTAEKTSNGYAFKNSEGKYLSSEYGTVHGETANGGGIFLTASPATPESWTYSGGILTSVKETTGSGKNLTWEEASDATGGVTSGSTNLFSVRSTGDTVTLYRYEDPSEVTPEPVPVTDKAFQAASSLEDGAQYVITAEGYGMSTVKHDGYLNGSNYSYSGLQGAAVTERLGVVSSTVYDNMVWTAHQVNGGWTFENSAKYLTSYYSKSTTSPGGKIALGDEAETWKLNSDSTLQSVTGSGKYLTWENSSDATNGTASGSTDLFSIRSSGDTIKFYKMVEKESIPQYEVGTFVKVSALTNGASYVIAANGNALTTTEHGGYMNSSNYSYKGLAGKAYTASSGVIAGDYTVWTAVQQANGWAFVNEDEYLAANYTETGTKGGGISLEESLTCWTLSGEKLVATQALNSSVSKDVALTWDTTGGSPLFTARSVKNGSNIEFYELVKGDGTAAVKKLEDSKWYVISAEGEGMGSGEHSGYTNRSGSGYTYRGLTGRIVEINGGKLLDEPKPDMLWKAVKVSGGYALMNKDGLYLNASYGVKELGGYIYLSDTAKAWVYSGGMLKTTVENDKVVYLTWENTDDATDGIASGSANLFSIRSSGDKVSLFPASDEMCSIMNSEHETIVYRPDVGGTVSRSKESIIPGCRIHGSVADANDGYHVVNWTDAQGTVVGTNAKLVPTAAGVYTANFAENDPVTIHYVANLNTLYSQEPIGEVSIASEQVAPVTGTPVGATATGYSGYHFVNWTDENGNVVSEIAAFVPQKSGSTFASVTYYANFDRNPDCVGAHNVALTGDGNYILEINGTKIGTYKLKRVADCWSIQDITTGKYLAVSKNQVVSADTFDYFHYDGGFYVNHGGSAGKSKVYLTVENGTFAVTESATDVNVLEEFSVMYHDYECCDIGGGMHRDVCKVCGDTHESAHEFENGYCKHCHASEVKAGIASVNVEITTQRVRFLIFKRTVYTARITVPGDVIVTKVEYNLNDGGWKSGSSVSSRKEITNLKIRVTDEYNRVTEWLYNGSGTVQS